MGSVGAARGIPAGYRGAHAVGVEEGQTMDQPPTLNVCKHVATMLFDGAVVDALYSDTIKPLMLYDGTEIVCCAHCAAYFVFRGFMSPRLTAAAFVGWN